MNFFQKAFAALLAALMLAGVLPVGAVAGSGRGPAPAAVNGSSGVETESLDETDEYDKDYFDPDDYLDALEREFRRPEQVEALAAPEPVPEPKSPPTGGAMEVVPFLYRYLDGQEVVEEARVTDDYTLVTSNTVSMSNGWYYSNGNTVIDDAVTIGGEVNLILGANKTLFIKEGILIPRGATLYIWSELYGEDEAGILKATGYDSAGIGAEEDELGGVFIMGSGTVYAEGDDGAGIGGGNGSDSGMERIVILGGAVTANGDDGGAGIGRGEENEHGGSVEIYGGSISATGSLGGAGIGGGNRSASESITVYGGEIEARGGQGGAGIGGGMLYDQVKPIVIHDGEIKAVGGQGAAGIGAGNGDGGLYYENMGDSAAIYILGGNIEALGGDGLGAGVGAGEFGTNAGLIYISGGLVNARTYEEYHGWGYAAGIGAGAYREQTAEIVIDNAVVVASSGGAGAGIGAGASLMTDLSWGGGHDAAKITMSASFVTAISLDGAGIGGSGGIGGGGGGNGGDVTVYSGEIHAISTQKGAGIGGGNDGDGGKLTVYSGHIYARGGYIDYDHWQQQGHFDLDFFDDEDIGNYIMNVIFDMLAEFIYSGEFGGAGIGGGDDGDGGTVKIYNGTVIASAGMNTARAFGRGDGGEDDGSLRIASDHCVTYGHISDYNEHTIEIDGVALKNERISRCHSFAHVEIDYCTHPNAEYECSSDYEHLVTCPNCSFDHAALSHFFDDDDDMVCDGCGYERVKITLLPYDGAEVSEGVVHWCRKGGEYTLLSILYFPDFSSPGQGMVFAGWNGTVGGVTDMFPAGCRFTLEQSITFTASWAQPYNLKVCGIQVTEANKDDVLGFDEATRGMVSYDPETMTLHFNGMTALPEVGSFNRFVESEGINLTVTGSVEVTLGAGTGYGFYAGLGSLTLNGDIGVTLTEPAATGVYTDKYLVFDGGSIRISAGSNGVRAMRGIVINGSVERLEIEAVINQAVYGSGSSGIQMDGSLVITLPANGRIWGGTILDPDNGNQPAKHVIIERGALVTFKLNGGMLGGSYADVVIAVPIGGTVTPPAYDPTFSGLEFGGWFADEAMTTPFDLNSPVTGDTTVWAGWMITHTLTLYWSDYDCTPETVSLVLQHFNRSAEQPDEGEWVTLQTITIDYEHDHWRGRFEPVPFEGIETEFNYRIRELDSSGAVVLSEDDDGVEERPVAVYDVAEEIPDPTPEPTAEPTDEPGRSAAKAITWRKVAYFARYLVTGRKFTEIHNVNGVTYTVNNEWDIDLIGGDRPEEIQVVLQRRNNWISWDSVEVLTLNSANNWSGTFAEVPVGRVNEDGRAELLAYRIRQLKARGENDPEPVTEEEILAEASARTIYDKWDFDKPYLKNLLQQVGDPLQYWSFDMTMKFLGSKVSAALLGNPTAKYHVDEYTDIIGERIEEHNTKYFIKYDQNDTTHTMALTNIAVLDISIYKRWINFEDNEMPESVYLMLVSKVDDDYAEQVGLDQLNIYNPVLTAVYGDRFDISKVTGLDNKVKSGIEAVLGDNIGADIVNGIVSRVISSKLSVGLAVAKADGKAENPLIRWRVRVGVKKYGGFGVPMEFAGTELVTGLIEIAVDALIKYLEIPKINMPVMYEPFNGYWSVKGYAIWYPILDEEDIELTCNVINIKFHGDEDERGTAIGGTVHWENDTEEMRPESVQIHIYAKGEGEDGERTELEGSPITVSKNDDWIWSFEIPKDRAIELDEDESEDGVIHYANIEIEEEVPAGYEARYEGYDVINRAKALVPPTVDCVRAELRQRATEDDRSDLRFVCVVAFNDSFVEYGGQTYGHGQKAYRIDSFCTELTAVGNTITVEGRNIFSMYENAQREEDPNRFIYTAVLVSVRPAYYDTPITATPYLTYSYNGASETISGNSVTAAVNGILSGD